MDDCLKTIKRKRRYRVKWWFCGRTPSLPAVGQSLAFLEGSEQSTKVLENGSGDLPEPAREFEGL